MKQENTVSNSGKDYRFSRVYLLRFSKGQFEPCDIHLNNNNIGRRDKETTHKAGGIAAALKLREPNFSNELKIASHVGPTWAQCNA